MKKLISSVIGIAGICLLAASLSLQCSPKDDGTYMNCHRANITVAVISCVIAIIGIVLPLLRNTLHRRILLAVSAIASILCTLVPGVIISLCMMPQMTCRAVFRPFTIAFSCVIFLFAMVGLLYEKRVKA
jgi:hypothetical protein